MSKMKILFVMTLAAILALTLCACASVTTPAPSSEDATSTESNSASETSTEPSSASAPSTESVSVATEPSATEEWKPDGPVEAKVVTAYEGSTPAAVGELECTYSLPRIEMPGPYIAAVNDEITQTFYENAKEYAYSKYDAYVTGNFLTVIISSFSVYPSDSNVEEYTIYTINIEACRLATEDELLSAAEMTKEEFTEAARAALLDAFLEYNGASAQDSYEYAEYVTDEYLSRAFPYFASDGTLWAHGIVCTLGGSGQCNAVVPLN